MKGKIIIKTCRYWPGKKQYQNCFHPLSKQASKTFQTFQIDQLQSNIDPNVASTLHHVDSIQPLFENDEELQSYCPKQKLLRKNISS